MIDTIQVKLTGNKNTREGRNRYQKWFEEQQTDINKGLTDKIKQNHQSTEDKCNTIKDWLQAGTDMLPKEPTKDKYTKTQSVRQITRDKKTKRNIEKQLKHIGFRQTVQGIHGKQAGRQTTTHPRRCRQRP